MYRNWIEVDKKALENNFKEFKNIIQEKCELMAVVKSNAYGHDIIQYSKTMVELGADYLGVDSITEAIALRQEGIELPILVLGYTLPENYQKAADNDIEITISSMDQLETVNKSGIESILKIQLKIDTGMHRQGLQEFEIDKVISLLDPIKTKLVGIYTHLSSAKNPAFPDTTNNQLDKFDGSIKKFEQAGHKELIKHAAATAGTLLFSRSHYDMVRIGIGLMGYWPSTQAGKAVGGRINLTPALSWKSIISEIKKIKKDEGVGYDLTEKLGRDSKVAIIPIGYWHGYRRDLSSIGNILISGQRCKVLGRVSMDMIIVDVTDTDCSVGDESIIIGKQGNEEVSVYEIADLLDGSWYEVITQLNPQIKRTYKY